MTQTKRDVRQNAIRLSGEFRKLVTSIKVSHLPILNSFAIISNCLISWCSVLTGKDPIQVQGVNTEEVVFVCIFFFFKHVFPFFLAPITSKRLLRKLIVAVR